MGDKKKKYAEGAKETIPPYLLFIPLLSFSLLFLSLISVVKNALSVAA